MSSDRVRATFKMESLNSSVDTLYILRRTFCAFFFSASSFASSPQNKHLLKLKSGLFTRALMRWTYRRCTTLFCLQYYSFECTFYDTARGLSQIACLSSIQKIIISFNTCINQSLHSTNNFTFFQRFIANETNF